MYKLVLNVASIISCSIALMSCSTGRLAIAPEQLVKSKDIAIVPYKSSPIKVEPNFSLTTGMLLGAAFQVAAMSATAQERGAVAAYLNNASSNWNASVVTSEECVKVLRTSSKIKIASEKVEGLREIAGAESFRIEEPRKFVENNNYWSFGWDGVLNNFKKNDNSFDNYKNSRPQISSDWSLEVFDYGLFFNNETLHLGLILKLYDTKTGNRIAAGWSGTGWNGTSYDIQIPDEGFDLNKFDKIFRNASQKACMEVLSDMGIY